MATAAAILIIRAVFLFILLPIAANTTKNTPTAMRSAKNTVITVILFVSEIIPVISFDARPVIVIEPAIIPAMPQAAPTAIQPLAPEAIASANFAGERVASLRNMQKILHTTPTMRIAIERIPVTGASTNINSARQPIPPTIGDLCRFATAIAKRIATAAENAIVFVFEETRYTRIMSGRSR